MPRESVSIGSRDELAPPPRHEFCALLGPAIDCRVMLRKLPTPVPPALLPEGERDVKVDDEV